MNTDITFDEFCSFLKSTNFMENLNNIAHTNKYIDNNIDIDENNNSDDDNSSVDDNNTIYHFYENNITNEWIIYLDTISSCGFDTPIYTSSCPVNKTTFDTIINNSQNTSIYPIKLLDKYFKGQIQKNSLDELIFYTACFNKIFINIDKLNKFEFEPEVKLEIKSVSEQGSESEHKPNIELESKLILKKSKPKSIWIKSIHKIVLFGIIPFVLYGITRNIKKS